MKQPFVIVLIPRHPVTPENHPALFQFLLSNRPSAMMADDVFCVTAEGDAEAVHGSIRSLLTEDDDVIVLQVSACRWSVGHPELKQRLLECFS